MHFGRILTFVYVKTQFLFKNNFHGCETLLKENFIIHQLFLPKIGKQNYEQLLSMR